MVQVFAADSVQARVAKILFFFIKKPHPVDFLVLLFLGFLVFGGVSVF